MDNRPLVIGGAFVLGCALGAAVLLVAAGRRIETLEDRVRALSPALAPPGAPTPAAVRAKGSDRLAGTRRAPSSGPGGAPPAPDVDGAVAALAIRVGAVEERLEALSTHLQALGDRGPATEPAPAGPRGEGGDSSPRAGKEAARKRDEAASARRLLEISERHAGELRDAGWADRVEGALRAEMAKTTVLADHARLEGIDCRTSLCRVIWSFAGGLSGEQSFEVENEMAVALARAGLNRGVVNASGHDGGGGEGFFFRSAAPDRPGSKR